MVKSDGSVLVHADAGGYKPLNWMTPPTAIEEEGDPLERLVVRKRAGKTEDRLDIRIFEVLSDVSHDMGEAAALEKDGVERDLQAELAAQPDVLERRPTARPARVADGHRPGGPHVPRRGGRLGCGRGEARGAIEAVEQLGRYLERIRIDPSRAACRAILAAQIVKPQAATLAAARGIGCVEVDLEVLRGEREPELTLFAG